MQHFDASDGVKLAYTIDDFTDPWLKPPTLLLLHGYPQTNVMYHRVAPALAKSFTLVIPDLVGYGWSAVPAESARMRSPATVTRTRIGTSRTWIPSPSMASSAS